jgi:hypothetical protein
VRKEEEWVTGEREAPMEEDADPSVEGNLTGEAADALTEEEAEETSEVVTGDQSQSKRGKKLT